MVRINVEKTVTSQAGAENRIEEAYAPGELFCKANHCKVIDGDAAEVLPLVVAKRVPTKIIVQRHPGLMENLLFRMIPLRVAQQKAVMR